LQIDNLNLALQKHHREERIPPRPLRRLQAATQKTKGQIPSWEPLINTPKVKVPTAVACFAGSLIHSRIDPSVPLAKPRSTPGYMLTPASQATNQRCLRKELPHFPPTPRSSIISDPALRICPIKFLRIYQMSFARLLNRFGRLLNN
jgi:hypothetical protein